MPPRYWNWELRGARKQKGVGGPRAPHTLSSRTPRGGEASALGTVRNDSGSLCGSDPHPRMRISGLFFVFWIFFLFEFYFAKRLTHWRKINTSGHV